MSIRKRSKREHVLLENVIAAHASSTEAISQTMGVHPRTASAHHYCPCRRSRHLWTNIPLSSHEPAQITWMECIDPGWHPAWILLEKSGPFGTYLRPFPPGSPSEYPAPFWRLPLSTYDIHGLVVRSDLSEQDHRYIADRLRRVDQASGDPRIQSSPAFKHRKDLCEFIHLHGGIDRIRPLHGHERDLSLGFPASASDIPLTKKQNQTAWNRLQASGNTFAIPCLRKALHPYVEAIKQHPILLPQHLRLISGFPKATSAAEALISLKTPSLCKIKVSKKAQAGGLNSERKVQVAVAQH